MSVRFLLSRGRPTADRGDLINGIASAFGLAMTLLGFIVLASPLLCHASNKNVGTSGAQFLKIGAGARPTAMGDAVVALADDVNAVYFNPAGLGYLSSVELTAMHTQWIQDMNYEFGALVYPSQVGTFGFSAATLKVEDQEKRESDESLSGTFDTLDAAYGLSYGKLVLPRLSLGGTIRFIDQEIDTTSAQTWSGDVGGLYKLADLPLSLGLAVRHFGQKVKFNEEGDPLPLTINYGLGANLFKDRLKLGTDVRHPRDNDVQFGVGGEWVQYISEGIQMAGRAGYNSATTDADGASGVTLGGGLGLGKFRFDFAWVPFGDLGNTMRYSIHFLIQ